ncbi:MAG: O-antigen ligase family protein [Planctomycetota bacterium]|jgi:O-antigen ligase
MTAVNLSPDEEPGGKARPAVVVSVWVLTLLLLGVSPWGWGGADAAFAAALLLGADVLLFLTALLLVLPPRAHPRHIALNPFFRYAAALGLLFCLFTALQCLPLPWALLKILSPSTADLRMTGDSGALSLAPEATKSALVAFLSTGALFLAPLIVVRSGRGLTRGLGFMAVSGAVVAAYSLLNFLSVNEVSLHFARGTHGGRASGSFVNPNHLATYLAVLLPAPLAILFLSPPRGRAGGEDAVLVKVSDFLADLSRRYWKILAALALAFISLSLVFTMSRAGILAGALGATAFFSLYAALRRKGAGLPVARMLTAVCFVSVLVGAALWLGLEPIIRRYGDSEIGMRDRFEVWVISLRIFMDFPLFGTGLGTFTDIFPLRQPAALHSHYTFPHNEYVGLLVECGAIGTLLLAGSAVLGLIGFVRELLRFRYRRTRQLAACAATGGTVAFVFHGVFDFAAHLPAVAFLTAFVMGLGFASIGKPLSQSRRRRAC